MNTNILDRKEYGRGIYFSTIRKSQWRHNTITMNFIVDIDEKSAAETAILPFVMRKSNAKYPDFTVLERRLCELYGASLSADILKFKDKQILSFSVTSIDDRFTFDGEKISEGCADLLCDMVLSPNFKNGEFLEEEFLTEKQNLLDAIDAEINEKRSYAVTKCREMMFEGTDLAISKYGTRKACEELTSGGAAKRYSEILKTARIEVMFVGCGDAGFAKNRVQERLAEVERNYTEKEEKTYRFTSDTVKQKTEKMDVVQGKLVLGFNIGDFNCSCDKEDAAKMMVSVFGGTPVSKLFRIVREKNSLCYYCAARYDAVTSTMIVDIGVELKNREKAQAGIMEQLEEMKKGNITKGEIDETKLSLVNSLMTSKDGQSATEIWYLVQILRDTRMTPDMAAENLEKVTKEDIKAAANAVTLSSVYFLTGEDE